MSALTTDGDDMTHPKNPLFSHAELLKAIHYDPATGVFTRPSGKVVSGRPNAKGARRFEVLGYDVKEHRLAWFYVHGVWPKAFIDHINGDPGDNRIENLREAEDWQNRVNLHRRKRNKLGVLGVSRKKGGYIGEVGVNGVRYRTKVFSTPEAAAKARWELAQLHHGEFARRDYSPAAPVA